MIIQGLNRPSPNWFVFGQFLFCDINQLDPTHAPYTRASIPAGTFNVQSENPFRRAVRRIEERRRLVERRRQRRMNEEEEEDSEGASSSTEEEGGPVRVLGNQLLAEVHIEQPAVQV